MMAPLIHEARAELKVVVLDADFVALLLKNVGDFTRNNRFTASSAYHGGWVGILGQS
jgi:hypothetical protein